MELGDDGVPCLQIELVITLYDLCSRISEKAGFYVVPASCQTVEGILVPQFRKDFIFLVEVRSEIHQHHRRLLLQGFPSADTQFQTLVSGIFSPRGHGVFVRFEFLNRHIIATDVGTDHDEIVAEEFVKRFRFGGYNGVYAAHLIANLPADFE